MARLGGTAAAKDKAPKAAKTARAVNRPAPKAKPSGGAYIGLDIGTQSIKAVEVKGFGNALTVTAMGIVNTPPGVIQGGMVTNPKELAAALKQLIQKNGFKSRRVVSAATGADGVVVRVIELPRMSPGELAETMKWEIERQIPFSANDVEMSYTAIDDGPGTDPNNPNMEVLLAVARRELIGLHLDTLKLAGLTPAAIDVETLASGRALLDLNKQGLMAKNVVIVNIGAALSEVGVFRHGTLRFPRTIPIAGDNFTRAIADHLGLQMEAAEDEKRQNAVVLMEMLNQQAGGNPFENASSDGPSPFDIDFGGVPSAPIPPANPFDTPVETTAPTYDPFGNIIGNVTSGGGTPPPPVVTGVPAVGTPDDPRQRRRREIFDALLPVLGELVMEVRRSIDYFRSRYPNDTVDQILLCGGSAKIGNLDQYFTYDLGIPTVVADPFKNVILTSKQFSAERMNEVAPAFTVALGLAARDAVIGSGR